VENWSDGAKGTRNSFSAFTSQYSRTPTLHHSMWAEQITCYEKYDNFPASGGIEIPRSLIK
jgi:hypothetical protein